MGDIRIANLRDIKLKEGEVLIRVDRSSILGNPFKMKGSSKHDRKQVCKEYKYNYFNPIVNQFWGDDNFKPGISLRTREKFMQELRRIYSILVLDDRDVVLGCWCYPKECHAETIRDFIITKRDLQK